MPSRRASFVHSSPALMRAACSNATDFPFLEPDVDWTALAVSVKLSVATMAALVVIGIPIAYWTAFSTRRWKFLVEAVVERSEDRNEVVCVLARTIQFSKNPPSARRARNPPLHEASALLTPS